MLQYWYYLISQAISYNPGFEIFSKNVLKMLA
jgi:hypothetical protein